MNFLFRCAGAVALCVLGFAAHAVDPPAVIPPTCGLEVPEPNRIAGTTIGNYQVYAGVGSAATHRHELLGTSFDLQGLVEQGDLGSAIGASTRSQLIGIFYTFEQLDPGATGNNNPTYPVWYMIERDPAANGQATRWDAPITKYTFNGSFGNGGGSRSGSVVGLLSLQQHDTNKKLNAVVQLNGRTAYYCLQLADLTPSNTEEAPGASVQGIWGAPDDATSFRDGSLVVTRGGAMRGVLTFFDERGGNPGQPVWAYSDFPVAPATFPVDVGSVGAQVPYNGEAWHCSPSGPLACNATPLTLNVGSLQPIRLGTTTGSDRSLNVGVFRPTINGTVHGVTVRWAPGSALPLKANNCMVRMDATPAGLTPGSGAGQNNCPESTPQAPAWFTCATPQGQSSCSVTLRWRITDAFPHARVVAFDADLTNPPPIPVASSTLASTGMTFAIPAGKKYRFAVISGTSDSAPVIGRTQIIAATSAPTVTATGCTIASGTTCNVTVGWSGGTGTPALYRYDVTAGGSPAFVSSLASGSLSQALPAGRYRYDLHSASPPTAQNLLAASGEATVAAGPSSVSVTPTSCTIVAPATTCAASVSWNTTQVAVPFLFRIGVTPALPAQTVAISAQSGSVGQSLPLGTYRFELRSTNDPASGTNLLATSSQLTVTGSAGTPAVPTPPVDPTPPASDPESEKVGFTSGVFRVDETGNATYRVPLSLLPGRAGLTPQLALNYSSGNGDGIAGWGMALEGIGVITRCRLSVEAGDGINRAIGFAPDTSSFCLNGQRLIKVSAGAEGAENTEYRTEIDSYQRIFVGKSEVVLPNTGGTAFSQPISFMVQTKDGLIARYGGGTARRRATLSSYLGVVSNPYVDEWWLASLTDRHGNEITFDYSGSTAAGSLQLDRIRYEGGQVDFVYDARKPVVTIGAWGARLQNDRLLSRIAISNGKAGSPSLHHYELTYEALPSNAALQRLSSLATCRGTLCQAPTIFDWHDRPTGSQDSAGQGSAPGGGANFQDIRAYKYGDVNGDGRADLVWVDKTRTLRLSLSQPSAGGGIGFAATTSPTVIQCEQNGQSNGDACSTEGYQRTWALLDFNADGRDDLIVYQTDPALPDNSPLKRAWRIWLSNGSTFVRTHDLAEDPVNLSLPGTPRIMLADFDGDGLGDLLVNRVDGFGSDVRVYLLRKTGNAAMPYQFSAPHPVAQQDASGTVIVGPLCNLGQFVSAHGDRGDALDFNGDGSADLALRLPSNTCGNGREPLPETWTERQAREPGSVIVDANSAGTAVVFASKGLDAQGCFVFTLMPSLLGLDAANPETLRFGDINGDGFVDALVRRGGNTAPGLHNWDEIWGWFYGTPQGWEGPEGGYCVRRDSAGNCQPMGREGQVSLLDHDGDGRLDVWSRRYSSSASGDFSYDVMLWNGDGFEQPIATFFHGGDNTWMRGVSDLDGDGYYDNLIMRMSEVGASWKAKRTVAHHKPRNLLASIGYGLGATTYIDYAPLTFSTVYQRSTGAALLTFGRGSVVQDVLAPRYVVRRVRSSAPTAADASALAEMQYRYAGFRLQGGGRGGLGFEQVVSVDVENALTTLTEYNQHFPLTGSAKHTLAWSEGARPDVCVDPDAAACMTASGWIASTPGVVYSASADTWRWEVDGIAGANPPVSTLVGANRKPLRVMRATNLSNKREAAGAAGFVSATQTTYGSYDAYGNLLASTTVDFDDEAMSTPVRTITTANTYDNDTGSWILAACARPRSRPRGPGCRTTSARPRSTTTRRRDSSKSNGCSRLVRSIRR